MSLGKAKTLDVTARYGQVPTENMNETESEKDLQKTEAEDEMHVAIERRAYEIYMQRHPEEGNALSDWLQAEFEIRTTDPSGRQSYKTVEREEGGVVV